MNLVIVESPAKAKTIANFLGKNFMVESSIGHIRDMVKKDMGIDINNGFKPTYEISTDKKKIVTKLKKLSKQVQTIYLATDEDREGESIAWHLIQALNLPSRTPRIVFHEITKTAITKAIANPRLINQPLVDAQQARRVIDRLVGFEISPILWRKIVGAKSAGRVQSPVVRLVVEQERKIQNFTAHSTYKVSAVLLTQQGQKFNAKLKQACKDEVSAQALVQNLLQAKLNVSNTQKKPSKRNPSPPFMTSTLQQEASQKLGFSVKQTMNIAQNLYRDGHISYMRTDSLNLSAFALAAASEIISSKYGKEYLQTRQYKTKTKAAQEAHEAIRPTDLKKEKIIGIDDKSQKLYNLIRKRTLASQMAPAQLEKTQVEIAISNQSEVFIAEMEVLKFAGFLALYDADNRQDKQLPKLQLGDNILLHELEAKESFTHPPARYTEASLVKKIEEMGIGRPSTFATMISTVQERGYVQKGNIEGEERTYKIISIKNKKIHQSEHTEMAGADKNKLFPSSVAYLLTDFLTKYFDDIIDYQFTANLENDFDKIANQEKIWQDVVAQFYTPFHQKITQAGGIPRQEINHARIIGTHPQSGKPISVRLGRYGAFAQIGNKEDEEKPTFASLKKDQHLDTITLEEVLELFKMPREVGKTADGTTIKANYGRFGPYLQYGTKYLSLKEHTPEEIDLNTALSLIKAKESFDASRLIKSFTNSDIEILNGRFGPYIYNGKRGKEQKNITIKKIFGDKKPESLTLKECKDAIAGKLNPLPTKKTKKSTIK